MWRAKTLSAAAVDPRLAPVRQPRPGLFLRLGGVGARARHGVLLVEPGHDVGT
jgi:hypothetical protein